LYRLGNVAVVMPDISTKAKAQKFIGLDMDAKNSKKEVFKKETIPAWIKKAKANNRLVEI
jgi:nitrite reductase (cytochrome c-552)